LTKGAVGFSTYKGKGFFKLLAKAIKYFTHGKWSHSFLIINDSDKPERLLVQEAGNFGVYIVSFKKYLTDKYDISVYAPLVEKNAIDQSIDLLAEDLEEPYGYLQLLGFIWVWIVRKLFKKKIKNPITGGIICSEEVLYHLKNIRIDERFDKMDDNTTDPNMIYEIVLDSKFKELKLKEKKSD